MTPEWRAALADVAGAHARRCSQAGAPVCDGVRGRLRWELRATWLGGTRILDKLEAADFDVFARRPTLTAADVPVAPLAHARAGRSDEDRHRRGPRHQLLLLVPRAARRQAARDRRRLGLLPRGRRCGGRSAGGGEPRPKCSAGATSWRAASTAATPQTPQGRALQPLIARVQPAAAGVRGADRRRRDGSRTRAATRRSRISTSTASGSRRRSG